MLMVLTFIHKYNQLSDSLYQGTNAWLRKFTVTVMKTRQAQVLRSTKPAVFLKECTNKMTLNDLSTLL